MFALESGENGESGFSFGKGGESVCGEGIGGASALVLYSPLSPTSSGLVTGLGEALFAFLFNFREPILPKLSLGPFSALFLPALTTASFLLCQLLMGSACWWSCW